MGRTTATGWTTGSEQSFVHDFADRVQAAPALRAATEATVHVRRRPGRRRRHGVAHLVIAQHVAGTDDHRR